MSVTNPPRFEGTFLEHEDIKVVSLDHISSQPSILFPLKEIISVIRKLSPQTLIFIDGAHVFGGNLKLDLKDMDCDFYCTNLHKWGYTPRPCAILYIKQ
jgi:selenocysteine lyase/cysteine desulfurase